MLFIKDIPLLIREAVAPGLARGIGSAADS
jgi:hypothetical protein